MRDRREKQRKDAVQKNNPRDGWRHGGHPLKSRFVKSEALLDRPSPERETILSTKPQKRTIRQEVKKLLTPDGGANPVRDDPTASQARDLSSLAAVFHTKNTFRCFLPAAAGRIFVADSRLHPYRNGGAQPESLAPSFDRSSRR